MFEQVNQEPHQVKIAITVIMGGFAFLELPYRFNQCFAFIIGEFAGTCPETMTSGCCILSVVTSAAAATLPMICRELTSIFECVFIEVKSFNICEYRSSFQFWVISCVLTGYNSDIPVVIPD